MSRLFLSTPAIAWLSLCFFLSGVLPVGATEPVWKSSGGVWAVVAAGGGTRTETTLLLTRYEQQANNLLSVLAIPGRMRPALVLHAQTLLGLGENIVNNAVGHLPRCAKYLSAALRLSAELDEISIASLERNYHHDGALPKAPAECYHAKDLFVHAAAVHIMLREDVHVSTKTKKHMKEEITEVLAHISAVKALLAQ